MTKYRRACYQLAVLNSQNKRTKPGGKLAKLAVFQQNFIDIQLAGLQLHSHRGPGVYDSNECRGYSFNLTKLLTSTCVHFRICHPIMLDGICKNTHFFNLPISRSNHYNIMMASMCTDQYSIVPFSYARARTRGRAMQSNNVWKFFPIWL